MSWHERAACATAVIEGASPEEWFPNDPNDRTSYETPKKICSGCPVKSECLHWARTNGVRDGIWGGRAMRTDYANRSRYAA